MYLSTHIIANTILNLAFKEKINITSTKLQKLLYLIYKNYLQKTKRELFSERFEVWKYGPVLPSIHYTFGCFEKYPITEFSKNVIGGIEIIDLSVLSPEAISIKKIWTKYKNFSEQKLFTTICKNNSAWDKAVKQKKDTLHYKEIYNEKNFH